MNALDPSLLFFPLSSRNLQASSGHFPSHHLTSRPPDPQPRLVTTVTSGSPLIHLVCALELLSYPEFSSGTFPVWLPGHFHDPLSGCSRSSSREAML